MDSNWIYSIVEHVFYLVLYWRNKFEDRAEARRNHQEYQYQNMSLVYNKSFKFVPGLRPSTGHKNAAHFYAA
jgi:hypothetical protein